MEFVKNLIRSFNKENFEKLKRSFTGCDVYIEASKEKREDLKSYFNFSICTIFIVDILFSIIIHVIKKGINMDHENIMRLIVVYLALILIGFFIHYLKNFIGVWLNAIVLSWFKNRNIKYYGIKEIENMVIIALIPTTAIKYIGFELLAILGVWGIVYDIWKFIVYIGFINVILMKYHKNNSIEKI